MSAVRTLARDLQGYGLSERTACRVLGLGRSRYRYRAREDPARADVRDAVVATARQHRRYGYRRVAALPRRKGLLVNHTRVWSSWREERLSLPRRRHKRRSGTPAAARPTTAERRNQVWTYDFLFDRTDRGQVLKLLTVVDEHTRECQAIRGERCLASVAVIDTLAVVVAEQGAPA